MAIRMNTKSESSQRDPPDIILLNYTPQVTLDVPIVSANNYRYANQRHQTSQRQSKINRMLDSFLKLSILKILIIDIGISVGDTATDFLQGVNLLQKEDTFYYGIVVISSKWVPVLVSIIHLWFSRYSSFLVDMGYIKGTLFIVLVILIFPILPSLLYLNLLFTRKQTDQKKLKAKEKRAHEIRSIAGSVESPIQVIIVLYLILRGKIPLPWDEPLDSSCLEDSLGRVACLPSIPIATLIFSLMAIIKAMFNLNVYPILADQENSLTSTTQFIELFFRFTPFFVANVIFRLGAFSFMLIYFDIWATVPIVILFVFNFIIYSICFTKFHKPPLLPNGGAKMNSMSVSTKIRRPNVLNLANNPNQYKCYRIGWNPNITIVAEDDTAHSKLKIEPTIPEKEPPKICITLPEEDIISIEENVAESQIINLPDKINYERNLKSNTVVPEDDLSHIGWKSDTNAVNEESSPLTPTTPTSEVNFRNKNSLSMNRHMASFVDSIYSTTTITPRYINEENTCIFLNSFSAMFFPSCHTHLHPLNPQPNANISVSTISEHKISELITWQKTVFKKQAFMFNSVVSLILVIIFFLIRFTPFRYHDNILDPFWFNMVFGSLIFIGIIGTLLALESDCYRLIMRLQYLCTRQKYEGTNSKKKKLTTVTRSVSNMQSSYFNDFEASTHRRMNKSKTLCKKTWICISAIIFIFIPIIIAFILYRELEIFEPYVFIIQPIPDSSIVNATILGASLISVSNVSHSNIISGNVIIIDCSMKKHSSNTTDRKDKILVVVNYSTCGDANKAYDFLEKINVEGIILIDNTPKRDWRVSSGWNDIGVSGGNIPVLMIRNKDWRKLKLTNNDKFHMIFRKPNKDDLGNLLHCTDSNNVDINNQVFNDKPSKYLSQDGYFFEHLYIDMKCWSQGKQCSQTYLNTQFEKNVECENHEIKPTSLQFVDTKTGNNQRLQPNSLPFYKGEPREEWKKDCCYKLENKSLFLSTLGTCSYLTWADVKIARQNCKVTHSFMGAIRRDQRENEKFCVMSDQERCVIRETYSIDPSGDPLSITCFSHCLTN